MRELERDSSASGAARRIAIVGAGRLGRALARALADAGCETAGPLGHGADGAGADAVLLCVPDAEIALHLTLYSRRTGRGMPVRSVLPRPPGVLAGPAGGAARGG